MFTLVDCVRYNTVITRISLNRGYVPYIFNCNFGQAEENRSFYRGLHFEVHCTCIQKFGIQNAPIVLTSYDFP